MNCLDEGLKGILVRFSANIENLMKIPVVEELISWMAEGRAHIKRLLFSSVVNFLNRTRFVHLDIDFDIKLSALGLRLFVSPFTFNSVNNQMNCLHITKFELGDVTSLGPFKLISFIDNLVMILVDERILPRFFKLMQSIVVYNKADSRFGRNITSFILHFFVCLFLTKILLSYTNLTFLVVELDTKET